MRPAVGAPRRAQITLKQHHPHRESTTTKPKAPQSLRKTQGESQNALSKGAIHTWNVSDNRPELVAR